MISMEDAATRVEERVVRSRRNSGVDAGIRSMLDDTPMDSDEAFECIGGLCGAVPSPLSARQLEAVKTALAIAVLTGYEVGRSERAAESLDDALVRASHVDAGDGGK